MFNSITEQWQERCSPQLLRLVDELAAEAAPERGSGKSVCQVSCASFRVQSCSHTLCASLMNSSRKWRASVAASALRDTSCVSVAQPPSRSDTLFTLMSWKPAAPMTRLNRLACSVALLIGFRV